MVPEAVSLVVCLIANIESIVIAKLVEVGMVGVVRGADCIDVVALHEQQVLDDYIMVHNSSIGGIVLMPVDPTNVHCRSVHQELSALELNLAEANPERNVLHFHSMIKSTKRDPIKRKEEERPQKKERKEYPELSFREITNLYKTGSSADHFLIKAEDQGRNATTFYWVMGEGEKVDATQRCCKKVGNVQSSAPGSRR